MCTLQILKTLGTTLATYILQSNQNLTPFCLLYTTNVKNNRYKKRFILFRHESFMSQLEKKQVFGFQSIYIEINHYIDAIN